MIRILESALKHGIDDVDILQAWNYPIQDFFEGEDPEKIIRLGFDTWQTLRDRRRNLSWR